MSGSLDHSPADVIRTRLIDLGLGTGPSADSDWPAYVAREPDTPDNVITVYNTAGRLSGRSHLDGEVFEHYGIMVRVRAATHFVGSAKADAIKEAIDKSMINQIVTVGDDAGTGSAAYMLYAATRTGSVNELGKETPTSKRNLFTINALVALRQAT